MRTVLVILVILVMSTMLKLLLLWPAAELPLRQDQLQFMEGAVAISQTGVPKYSNPVWDEAHASPLYPYGLAAHHKVFGPEGFLTAARVTQVLLSALTALLVYFISLRLFGRKNALLSLAAVAFFPTFIAYSHYLFTETVYTFLLVGLVAHLLARDESPSPGHALAAGFIAGLAALTRGAFILQVPFVLLWLLSRRGGVGKQRAMACAAFLLGMAGTIAPWSIRNTLHHGEFLLIDTNGGNVLHKNWNALRPENHDVGIRKWGWNKYRYSGEIPFRERVVEENIIRRSELETRAAVQFTLAHPLLFARNSVIRAANLANPTSFLVRTIRRRGYAGLPPLLAEVLVWMVLLSTMAALGFGTLGLIARLPTYSQLLPMLLIAGNVVVCVLIVSMSRYRFPMMPLLIPFAVEAALHARVIATERGTGWWISLGIIALMSVAWFMYIPYSL